MERHLGYAMTLGDLSFIKTYLSEFTGVCPPPCVMIFDADDVTTIVDHCNHFTQPQAETAFPFQYQLAQLRKRFAGVAFDFFQGHRVAMACSKPAVAGDVKQTAVAVLDQG